MGHHLAGETPSLVVIDRNKNRTAQPIDHRLNPQGWNRLVEKTATVNH